MNESHQNVHLIGLLLITLVMFIVGVFSEFTHPSVPWLIAANAVLLSLGFGFVGWTSMRKGRLILKTPLSKICDLKSGLASVQGKVEPIGKILQSPMTGAECVYYNFKVDEHKGGDNPTYTNLVGDMKSNPFQLTDSTGAVEVSFDRESLLLARTYATSKENRLLDKWPRLRDHERHTSWPKHISYTETVIRVGCELYVLGKVTAVGTGSTIIKAMILSDKSKQKIVAMRKGNGFQFLIVAAILGVVAMILPFIVPANIFKTIMRG